LTNSFTLYKKGSSSINGDIDTLWLLNTTQHININTSVYLK